MTYEMKMLLTMGLKHTKHYDIIHHVKSNIFTLRVWINAWEHIDFTTSSNIQEKHVMVKYMQQSKSWFSPSLRVSNLDKLCGKSKRVKGHKYSIITLDQAFEIVQKLETKFPNPQYSRPQEQVSYPVYPEEIC